MPRIEARPVEWMSHLADQPTQRLARQARVSIERHDVFHVGRKVGRLDKHRVSRAAQQAVQLGELASLPLPPDPAALALVPDSSPVQKEEAIALRARSILAIELRDACARRVQKRLVLICVFCSRIRPVGQQREVNLALDTGEMMDFKLLDLLINPLQRREHGWHRNQSAVFRRHAATEIDCGQERCAEPSRHNVVHDRHRYIDRGNGAQHGQRN